MRVLIVGAGIGGLATAISLRKAEKEVVVVERAEGPASEGFSITIPSNGTRALHDLGVLSTLRPVSVVIHRMEYIWQNTLLSSTPLAPELFGGWPWLALQRSELLSALAARVTEVRYGVDVLGLEELGDSVAVKFSDGNVDRFDLVIGADGTNSTVRSFMPGSTRAEWAGLLYYRTSRVDRERDAVMSCYLGEDRIFCIFPGGPGRVYSYGAIPAPEPTVDAVLGRRARLVDQFESLGEEPARFIAETKSDEDFSCTPPTWVRTDRWHTGRIVLVGDAAHASPPFMAQGACLAMEDGLALGDCLGSMALDAALLNYAQRRKPRAALVHQVVASSTASITNQAAGAARIERLRQGERPPLVAQLVPLLEPL